jgi:ubiquinone/menaquinone biosynthesis C-methylase UbiE
MELECFRNMAGSWTSYDSAAECHDRLAAPSFFEQPARDLVARIDARSAARILDVGTGSELAALLAAKVADPQAIVVGLDPSIEMLRIARRHGLRQVVSGGLPGLPFTDRSFDRILASFVLSHLRSYESGLTDMVRVLRPRGARYKTNIGNSGSPWRNHSLARNSWLKRLGKLFHGRTGSRIPDMWTMPCKVLV